MECEMTANHIEVSELKAMLRWPRELNALQIEKTPENTQHTRCKCSQHTQKNKRAANRKKHLQIKKTLSSLWQRTCCKSSQHTQKRNTLQTKCICLCCEHLHHLLSNWWKCFLDLLVLFLFACVFWSCSALSSLGHRTMFFYRWCPLHVAVGRLWERSGWFWAGHRHLWAVSDSVWRHETETARASHIPLWLQPKACVWPREMSSFK